MVGTNDDGDRESPPEEGDAATDMTSRFPNLFVETLGPTFSSIMIFAFADLRELVRDRTKTLSPGEEKSTSVQILDLPMSYKDILRIAQSKKDVLRLKVSNNEFNTVEYILSDEFQTDYHPHIFDPENITVHHVGDDNANQECVHAVISDSKRKQIILIFRGSITMHDWIVDAKLVTGDLANPLYIDDDDHEGQPAFIGVHVGFRDYLYGETQSKRKIDVILDQIQVLMDAMPGYSLRVTGHSLGGALALLFSLQAAVRFSRTDIPVTCVTIANPRVGDHHFREAIQSLERRKKLRCLTVHNHLDLVPSMPNRMCRGDFCRPNSFCQPGMALILSRRGFWSVYHGERNDTKCGELGKEMQRFFITMSCWINMGHEHNYRTYLDRLIAQKDELRKLYLNELYEKEGIYFD